MRQEDSTRAAQLLLSPLLRSFHEALAKKKDLLFEGLWASSKMALLALAKDSLKTTIAVITASSHEEDLLSNAPYFGFKDVLEFPDLDLIPEEKKDASPDIVGRRLEILSSLRSKSPFLLFTSLAACLQKCPSIDLVQKECRTFYRNDRFPFNDIEPLLHSLGYRRRPIASEKGDYALRSGIVDIYPVSSFHPIRVELFGDEIDTLRSFDPVSQKTLSHLESFFLTPAVEKEEKRPSSLFDYLSPDTLIVFDDMVAIEDKFVSLQKKRELLNWQQLIAKIEKNPKLYFLKEKIEEIGEKKYIEAPKGRAFYSGKDPFEKISFEIGGATIAATRMLHPFSELSDLFSVVDNRSASSPEEMFYGLSLYKEKISVLHCIVSSEAEKRKFKALLEQHCKTPPSNTQFEEGYLSSGFAIEDTLQIFFPMTELSCNKRLRRQKWRSSHHSTTAEFHKIEIGDLVVHFHQGIGRYLGIEKRENHVKELTEFLVIEYAEGGKLYVPIQQAYLISRYIGSNEEMPTLHVIGGKSWQRVKAQAEKAIVGYAKDLLDLQAKRTLRGGFACPADGEELQRFEADFPYEATEDQLRAIQEIKEEMEKPVAMDRLICGDVGYGKTEVAMRAAFKALSDGKKQVAVLVPTTVLALQHYESFIERMKNFSVEIGCISRFQTPREVKETLQKASSGQLDILIGTHRLISKDVVFKDLGLIIIDEEQRFGVRAKEHLKTLKENVDCLTLSATPIPRTLYMSLVGARTISTINTPPYDRLPITSLIVERESSVIHNALLRELSRDGQAFFIHNRVETIFLVQSELQAMLPMAKIVVGHGQMSPDEIDSVFHAFKSGEADILVATTIVENGIDIPNANTILIDRAEQFGLSDLYQMRGRVGRWNRPAYAYFLTSKHRPLQDLQRKRLFAMSETSGYGGGMRLAMRDLELRGAGDILGTQQSGHIAMIGFHLYCKLLKQTLLSLEKQESPDFFETKVEFTFDARIPESYISESSLRIEMYHRFGDAKTLDELEALISELKDRFGPLTKEIIWLVSLTRIKIRAREKKILLLKFEKTMLTIESMSRGKVVRSKVLLPPIKKPEELEKTISHLLFPK